MKKLLILLALLLGILTTSKAQAMTMPKREVRAVWLTTLKNLDWPYAGTRQLFHCQTEAGT